MRKTVDVGSGVIEVQGDNAHTVVMLAAFIDRYPNSTMTEITNWLHERGLTARVAMLSQTELRTSK